MDFLVGFEMEFVVFKIEQLNSPSYSCCMPFGHYAVAGLRDPSYQYVEQ